MEVEPAKVHANAQKTRSADARTPVFMPMHKKPDPQMQEPQFSCQCTKNQIRRCKNPSFHPCIKLQRKSSTVHRKHEFIGSYKRNGLDLITVHCKSANGDLGVHFIKADDSYTFDFQPNLWGTALYLCRFTWTGTFHLFDIYVFKRVHPLCSRCIWKIRPQDPCMFNYDSNVYDIFPPNWDQTKDVHRTQSDQNYIPQIN
ncbi:hypothetical protein I3843_04G009600 [Carya illinoinensis]|nr:hypothetical protein I3843_04G009600 [Carya illinoinensis]